MPVLVFNRARFAPAEEPSAEMIMVVFSLEEGGSSVGATARLLRSTGGGTPRYALLPSEITYDASVADAIRDYAILADRRRKPGEAQVTLRVEVQIDDAAAGG